MNYSYWEIQSWFSNIDYTIIGSGIVGLNCALQLKQRFPDANIVVLEKGVLPQGASTKNAGFACFGSMSEIVDDLKTHSDSDVFQLVKRRVDGLKLLRETLGDSNINYKQNGGYELFSKTDDLFEQCQIQKTTINQILTPIFGRDVFKFQPNIFGFKNCHDHLGFNQFEGQIDTGKMMLTLTQRVRKVGVKILNNTTVEGFSENSNSVKIKTNHLEFSTSKLLIATNGFASGLNIPEVKPARAQVLITKPIENLNIKGTFHLNQGYYYFRNIDNRILFGGGRHLDFKGEETTDLSLTTLIQSKLEELLNATILPTTPFEIEHRWSGIMGVAIGSLIGKDLADLL